MQTWLFLGFISKKITVTMVILKQIDIGLTMIATKKNYVDKCLFNDEWTAKYCFMVISYKVVNKFSCESVAVSMIKICRLSAIEH